MKSTLRLSRRWSWAFGLVLSFVCLVAAVYYYLSTHQINVHITSRVFMLVLVLVIVIVLFVLPVYSAIVTNEIRKRHRVEKALIRAKEEAERASKSSLTTFWISPRSRRAAWNYRLKICLLKPSLGKL